MAGKGKRMEGVGENKEGGVRWRCRKRGREGDEKGCWRKGEGKGTNRESRGWKEEG